MLFSESIQEMDMMPKYVGLSDSKIRELREEEPHYVLGFIATNDRINLLTEKAWILKQM